MAMLEKRRNIIREERKMERMTNYLKRGGGTSGIFR